MTVAAICEYRCEICDDLEVLHIHNRPNRSCSGCGGNVEFVRVMAIHTKEPGEPWVKVEGEEMLKLLIFTMLPDPPKPALASAPP